MDDTLTFENDGKTLTIGFSLENRTFPISIQVGEEQASLTPENVQELLQWLYERKDLRDAQTPTQKLG